MKRIRDKETVKSVYLDSAWKRGPKRTATGEIDKNAPLGQEAVRRYLIAVQRKYSDEGAWPTAREMIMHSVEAYGYPIERVELVKIINASLKAADEEAEIRICGKRCAVYGCEGKTRKLTNTKYGSIWLCESCAKNGN